ncbi:MAG: rhodanese-like domain-containing protein [Campylobacteraceae bacterium]|nr:rhodanese-like domain-containing protein [Campylobacteraceae bacterium]
MNIYKIVLIFLFFTSFLFSKEELITSAKLEFLLAKNIVVIDIRREDEWQKTGIIPNSYRLTFYNKDNEYNMKRWLYIFARLVKSRTKSFVLVSSDTTRSKKLAKILFEEKKYHNVYYLSKGINAWIKEDKRIREFN